MFHPWSYMDAIYLRSLVFSLLLSSTGDGGGCGTPTILLLDRHIQLDAKSHRLLAHRANTARAFRFPTRFYDAHHCLPASSSRLLRAPRQHQPALFLRASTTRTTACPLPRHGYYAHHDNTSRRFSYALLRRAPPTTAMSLIYESD
jgi:hypothetical protein